MGVAVPANEVAERAERIRIGARSGRRLRDHRTDRARRGADHGCPRSGSGALPRGRLVRVPSPVDPTALPVGGHLPESGHVRRDERGCRGCARARTRSCRRSGRVLGPGLGGAAGGRHICRVARRRGRRPDDRGSRPGWGTGGVRAVPAAGPSRRPVHVRRLLLLQQRGDRGPRDHPGDRRARGDHRRRLPPRQRQPADLLASRRRPLRLHPRGPGAPVPVLPGPCRRGRRRRWGGGEPEHPAPGRRDERRLPRAPPIVRSRRSWPCPVRWWSSPSASIPTGWIRSATSP